MNRIKPEAEIEYVSHAEAICPACEEGYEVEMSERGEIECDCGIIFRWSTDI